MTSLADLYGDDDIPDPDLVDLDRTRAELLETLTFLVRRMNRVRALLNEIRAPYEKAIRDLAERQQWAEASTAQRVLHINDQIGSVARRLLESDPKVKTFKLPHGTVSTRHTMPEILVESEPDFIAWAKDAAPELLYDVPRIDKKAVKVRLSILPDQRTVVTPDGEQVPGVVVKPEQVSVTVREATLDDVELL